LKHRATASLDTCGYISGDPDSPVTCDLSYGCFTWKTYSVAGCCDTQTVATDCVIPTTCVPYNAYESCTTCVENSLATTCTSSASPFCYENHYLYRGGLTLTEYGCGTTSRTETVFPTPGTPAETSSASYIPTRSTDYSMLPTNTNIYTTPPVSGKMPTGNIFPV
jgi:hypothetical protein